MKISDYTLYKIKIEISPCKSSSYISVMFRDPPYQFFGEPNRFTNNEYWARSLYENIYFYQLCAPTNL